MTAGLHHHRQYYIHSLTPNYQMPATHVINTKFHCANFSDTAMT